MLLRARLLLPVSSSPIAEAGLLVRGERIADLGAFADLARRHPGEPVRDLGHAALLPGLVNVHAHLELSLLRGLLASLPFFPWIRRVVDIQRAAEPEDPGLASLAGAAEMIRAGTTCVIDCSATGAPLDALVESGLRGIVHQEVFAPDRSWLAAAVPTLERQLDGLSSRASARVRVGLSPHSPYMACPELLEIAARIACDRELPLSLHLAESRDEDRFLRDGEGPIADHFRARGFDVMARARSPVEHVAALGYLALPVQAQLVHLCRATGADLDRIARAHEGGARLGLAACPRSNAQLGNGAPDLAGWTGRGIPWGYGTDSSASAPSLSLWDEARVSDTISRLTLEAARSVGLERDIGSLEVGKQADLCALRLPAGSVELGADREVLLTMVAGRVLFDGRTITTFDEAAIRSRFDARAAALRAR